MQPTAYRSVVKNAAYIFFIKVFPALASVTVLILFSRKLPAAEYGSYQTFWIKWLLLGTLAYAGLPVTILTYAPPVLKHLMQQLRRSHFVIFFVWISVWSGVFGWLMLTGSGISFLLSLGLLMLYVAHAIEEALLLAGKHMKLLLFTNFLYGCYFILVHIRVLENFNLQTLLGWLLAGQLVRAVFLFICTIRLYGEVIPDSSRYPSLASVRMLWFHLGFYDLLQNIFRFIDKFLISLLVPAALYAIYFNGTQTAEVPFLPYLLGAVASSVLIQLSSGKVTDLAEGLVLMRQSGRLLSSVVFPLFFFLMFFNRELFSVVLSEKYLASSEIFVVAIMVLPLRAYNFTVLLQHAHKGAIIIWGALLDLCLALALVFPLYLLWGLKGVALSFVLSTWVQVGYYLYYISRFTESKLTTILPLGNWLYKLVLSGSILLVVYIVSSHYLAPSYLVLLVGLATMLLFSFFSLRREWKTIKR